MSSSLSGSAAANPLKTILHLGCGRKKDVTVAGATVIHLDQDARLQPDIVCCLGVDPIPLEDNSVDAAVAIHVLEHIGRQGETAGWFLFWEELYRVLKPGGYLEFDSPLYTGVWCWGDPSHTRALSPEAFIFFDQHSYRVPGSMISPFRINCDFESRDMHITNAKDQFFGGRLYARKPLKPWWEDDQRDA